MSVQLLHGDCLEVMKKLPAKSVDCFICDLPFGQLTRGAHVQHRDKYSCPWDVPIDLEKFWAEVERLARHSTTPIIHFCNTKFGIELINSKPDWFRYDLVWNKGRGVSFLLANKMPMKSHEMIYVFAKTSAYYKRIDSKGEYKAWKARETEAKTRIVKVGGGVNKATANDGTTRCVLSVLDFKKPNTKGHPTEKPKDIYRWLLERYCPPNGCVLDPTAGSFNSILVARELGLHAVGIEKDDAFFKAGEEKVLASEPPKEDSLTQAPAENEFMTITGVNYII